MFITPKPFFFR